MAYIVMAYVVMAYIAQRSDKSIISDSGTIVMAYVVMAYIVQRSDKSIISDSGTTCCYSCYLVSTCTHFTYSARSQRC